MMRRRVFVVTTLRSAWWVDESVDHTDANEVQEKGELIGDFDEITEVTGFSDLLDEAEG